MSQNETENVRYIRKLGEEIRELRERNALLESLLSEALRLGYINEAACSPSWLKEARKTVR
jgi:hypothetical protein